jgi:hypothetical protein
MARILNTDQLRRGFIRLTRGDIPEGLRSRALIGESRRNLASDGGWLTILAYK